MDKVLNSEENKQLFSTSSMIEKLAFKKVSEEDELSEIEKELMLKNASSNESCVKCYAKKPASTGPCKCACKGPNDCAKGCACGCKGGAYEKEMQPKAAFNTVLNKILVISEELDTLGFEKLAAASIMLADKLVSEAKAKKSDKKSKEEKSKSKSKMDMKARMKKMRDAQKGKKDKDSKKSKKSDKK